MDEYGLDDLADLSRAIRPVGAHARQDPRAEGTYRNQIEVEGFDGPGDYVVSIDVKGDPASPTTSRAPRAACAPPSTPFCYTNAMALHAIKSLLLPTIPNNAGSIAPISVFAPPGCILNALHPFATGGRHAMGHFVTPLVYGALAQALPDRVQAGSGMMNLINFQGACRDERPFSTLFRRRGRRASEPRWLVPCRILNMATVPLGLGNASSTIESKRLLPDTGGPGQWRGGLGQEVVLRNDTGHLITTLGMGNRTMFPARGMFGGGHGALRAHAIDGTPIHAKGRNELAPGQRMRIVEAGGGGFGDPKARARAAVAEDVAQGYVGRQAASEIYGWSG
jgi:N-methylhydantoinase B